MPEADTPKLMSSAELIREANRNITGGDTAVSEALMNEARQWLESQRPDIPLPGEPVDAGGPGPMAELEEQRRALASKVSELLAEDADLGTRPPPGRRPTRATTGPVPAPVPTGTTGVGNRIRRRVLGAAVAIGVVALLGNISALVISEDDSGPVVTQPVVQESTFDAAGSITQASDPCSGATISGDLDAVFTLYEDDSSSTLFVSIYGPALAGSDGTTYELEISGTGFGNPGQEVFVLDSDSMVMTRDDGTSFEDTAEITVEFEDGELSTWQYSSVGADC